MYMEDSRPSIPLTMISLMKLLGVLNSILEPILPQNPLFYKVKKKKKTIKTNKTETNNDIEIPTNRNHK